MFDSIDTNRRNDKGTTYTSGFVVVQACKECDWVADPFVPPRGCCPKCGGRTAVVSARFEVTETNRSWISFTPPLRTYKLLEKRTFD